MDFWSDKIKSYLPSSARVPVQGISVGPTQHEFPTIRFDSVGGGAEPGKAQQKCIKTEPHWASQKTLLFPSSLKPIFK